MKIIPSDKVIYTFKNKMKYVEKIKPGEDIMVICNDCWSQQIQNENQVVRKIDYNILNPATGPIFVEGAEQGDILKVKILKIDIKNTGSVVVVPNEGLLGEKVTTPLVRMIKIEDEFAIFDEVKVPIEPMIGVIGVAPASKDGDWATNTPWKHGGNMDTKDIKEGAIVYLPVNQIGGLLALGDCHAVMGDGEVCFTGLEVSGKVTLKIDLIKHKSINWPIVEINKQIMIVASGKTLDEATYEAINQAVTYLMKGLNINWEEAYMLASLAVDLKISQVVNPKMTVRATIPKSILSIDRLISTL